MRYRTSLAIVLVSSLSVTAAAQTAGNGGRKLTTQLTGAAEVNSAGVPNQGDPDGRGTAALTVNPGQQRICYELTVTNIVPAEAAHIHEAPAGSNGPVVVPLDPPADGESSACAQVTRALALEILKDPSDYYVNVHNAEYPAGAVRGQLGK